MADRVIGVTSKLEDQASAALKAQAAAARELGAQGAQTGTQLAGASEKVTRAKRGELSATKQVEHAIRLEAAAGKPLEVQLIKLKNEHERLAAQMRATVRAGGELDQGLVRQAAAAREAAERLQKGGDATRAWESAMTGLGGRFMVAASGVGLLSMAVGKMVANTPQVEKFVEAAGRAADSLAGQAGKGILERWLGPGTAEHATNTLNALADLMRTEEQQAEIDKKAEEILGKLNEEREEAAFRLGEIKRHLADEALQMEAEEEAKRAREAEKTAAALRSVVSAMEARRRELALAEDAALRDLSQEKTGPMLSETMKGQQAEANRQAVLERIRLKNEELDAEDAANEGIEGMRETRATSAETAAQREANAYTAAAKQIGSTMGQAFATMITSSDQAGEAAKQMMGQFVSMAVEAAVAYIGLQAAQAGTAAAASTAPTGPFALALGPALGAAVAGMVMGVASSLGMARGGIVAGGVPGQDSVPAFLMPGELVIPTEMTRQLFALAGRSGSSGRFAEGGVATAASPAGPFAGMTLVVHANTRREGEQAAEAMAAKLMDLNKRGKFSLSRVA